MDPERFFEKIIPRIADFGRYALAIQDCVRFTTKGSDLENKAASALTDADYMVQEGLLRYFLEQGYRFRVFAEEESPYLKEFPTEGNITLSLDPLDGTAAYIKGFKSFCTVVGIYKGQTLKASLVHIPADKKFYAATQDIERSWIWTPKSEDYEEKGYERQNFTYVPKCSNVVLTYNPKKEDPEGKTAKQLERLRAMGITVHELDKAVTNISLCSILRGDISGYFRRNVPCLDWRPISLIIEKAGGTVTDYNGNRNYHYQNKSDCDGTISEDFRLPSIIVSGKGNEKIHQDLVSVLGEAEG